MDEHTCSVPHPRQDTNKGHATPRAGDQTGRYLSCQVSVKLWSQYASHRSPAAQASLTMPCMCAPHTLALSWRGSRLLRRTSMCVSAGPLHAEVELENAV
jgi:hypothetical protein